MRILDDFFTIERMKKSNRWRAVTLTVVVAILAGCGGSTIGQRVAPSLPASESATAVPPPCKGQRTTKKYGSIVARIKRDGGSLCIPAFGGFGGSIEYPGGERGIKLTIRTSIQNIYDEPQLGNGTSIVYLNLHFHAGTRFHKRLKADGGLTSQAITPGASYTAYGIVAVGHLDFMFTPCYAVATQGTYGGVLPNLGRLLSKATIAGAGFGVIEIYSGQQVSQEC